jgi:hypothetical protein
VKRAWLVISLTGLLACGYSEQRLRIPSADAASFELEVYPILLADCGFAACHGTEERMFRVHGPGRTRLAPETEPYDPATPEELALTYGRARSMLISPDGVRRAPLLRKPLAVSAGGSGHKGDDPWGNSIFPSKRDERYETLFFWALSSQMPEDAP